VQRPLAVAAEFVVVVVADLVQQNPLLLD